MNDDRSLAAPTCDITPSLAEKRRTPRVELTTELTLYSESNFYAGFTEDISEGGVFVATYAKLPVGAAVSLHLSLPGDFEIRATGTVRWLRESGADEDGTEPPGMGIELEWISDEDRELIREFVRNRSPLFFDP
ncbi:MAG: TIGR02266 family protein [Sandaracinaceae bacterium]|nr:TIGR02266 family protein [Sandaracinaceae bacterium]